MSKAIRRNHPARPTRLFSAALLAVTAVSAIGCRHETADVFEPNLVHTMKYQIKEDIDMSQASEDTTWVVDQMFGTPDEPKLPAYIMLDEEDAEELNSIVSLDNLTRASGAYDAEGRGLYAKHCATCHGVTGNGRGTTAAVLTPYPRDYRKGAFKFKSTKRGAKPTREDLAKLIRNGIGGTAMAKIPELTEDDIQALVDYVIYLSWRGEVERSLVDDAIFELDLSEDRIVTTEFARKMTREEYERFETEIKAWKKAGKTEGDEPANMEAYDLWDEQWDVAETYIADIAESWLEAEDDVIDAIEPPDDIQVAENYADVVKFKSGDQAESFLASVKRGEELFVGKIASCSKCHGAKGLGDGQTTDYDDWTKDWTINVGLKPEDRDSLIPLLARGAMPPQNAIPRNFAAGVFRGGQTSGDLYRRIMQGIDGTPMPAATFVDGQFEQDDVWHIINFIRSLQDAPDPETPAATEPTESEPAEKKAAA